MRGARRVERGAAIWRTSGLYSSERSWMHSAKSLCPRVQNAPLCGGVAAEAG